MISISCIGFAASTCKGSNINSPISFCKLIESFALLSHLRIWAILTFNLVRFRAHQANKESAELTKALLRMKHKLIEFYKMIVYSVIFT